MKKLFLYVFLVLMFCNNSISDTIFTPKQVRTMNKERLNELEIGMSKDEVLIIMGTKGFSIESSPFTVENPFRIEVQSLDKHIYRVLYYYTDLVKTDGFITDDELTPVILKNNKLVGWGRDVWDRLSDINKSLDITATEPKLAGDEF